MRTFDLMLGAAIAIALSLGPAAAEALRALVT